MKTIAQIKAAAIQGGSIVENLRGQVISRREGKTAADKAYLELTVADATATERIRLWGDSRAYADALKLRVASGSFVGICAEWSHGNWGLSLRNAGLMLLTPIEELELLAGSPEQRRQNEAEWEELLGAFRAMDSALALFALFVCVKFETPLRRAGAAKGNHHARRGGLLAHVVSMLRCAQWLPHCYPEVDEALLATGILFHDLAKIYENDYDPKGFEQKPTFTGRLLGHIPLGQQMVLASWKEYFGPDRFPETRDHLIHLVLCHHGQKEWGSPIEPMTPEGFCLHYLDMIDSRMEILRNSYAGQDVLPGICEAVRPLSGSVARPWNQSPEHAEMQKDHAAQHQSPPGVAGPVGIPDDTASAPPVGDGTGASLPPIDGHEIHPEPVP